MSVTPKTSVTAVFASPEEAEAAAAELRRAGLAADEITVVPGRREAPPSGGVRSETGVTIGTGAGAGMLSGAALGGLAGSVPGMVVGAAAGGILGAFIDLGIPEDAAAFYQGEHEAGRTVVVVRSSGRAAEAAELLRANGATEVR